MERTEMADRTDASTATRRRNKSINDVIREVEAAWGDRWCDEYDGPVRSAIFFTIKAGLVATADVGREALEELLDALRDEVIFLELWRSPEVMEHARRCSALVGSYDDDDDWFGPDRVDTAESPEQKGRER